MIVRRDVFRGHFVQEVLLFARMLGVLAGTMLI